ncbi:hypothetical protein CR513_26486, partial [Mucuna pruriens]
MNIHLYLYLYIKLLKHGKRTYPTISSNWKGKEMREDKLLKRDKSSNKESAPFKSHRDEVSKVIIPNFNASISSNMKCFKYLGK